VSERKTAEIKFRVTPTEKAAWQQYAEGAQLGLSELIRREVNEGIRANEARQKIALLSSVGPIAQLEPEPVGFVNPDFPPTDEWVAGLRVVLSDEMKPGTVLITNITDVSPQEDVSTSDEVGASFDSVQRHPWSFEAQNG
jgi:hypothetical protein